jgi:hypothetical protein
VLPVPIIAATKSAACNEIAGKLLAAITGAAP